MKLFDRLKTKREPTSEELRATVPAELKSESPVVEQPKRYPIQIGEYFPLKGFMFRVTDVNDHGIHASPVGLTKSGRQNLVQRRIPDGKTGHETSRQRDPESAEKA